MTSQPVTAEPLAALRERTSSKWRTYEPDVLPLPVAEMDVPIPEPIKRALLEAIEHNDIGYPRGTTELGAAFATFARERWGWSPREETLLPVIDVGAGIVELLRRMIAPGDSVMITTPVYPPFWLLPEEAGGVGLPVPLLGDTETGWRLDLPAIEAGFAAGARVLLLCNPHNPTGTVHPRDELQELAQIALRHGGIIVSDEIHAPLVFAPAVFTPFLAVSEEARRCGVTVTSGSKAWNLAGLKYAFFLAQSPEGEALLARIPGAVPDRVSILGLKAQVAAFREGSDWLDGLLKLLDENRRELAKLLTRRLPLAKYRIPEATYLAWVDLSAYGWGPNPADTLLQHGRVAFGRGTDFDPESGKGFVRINFGTSPEIVTEAIERVAALTSRDGVAHPR